MKHHERERSNDRFDRELNGPVRGTLKSSQYSQFCLVLFDFSFASFYLSKVITNIS